MTVDKASQQLGRKKDEREEKLLTAEAIKQRADGLGADLCGIAPVERFSAAPEGFRPSDVFGDAKSVIAIAKRIPTGALVARSPVPYTAVCELLISELLKISCELSLYLQDAGAIAVPVPSEPYEYWNEQERVGKGMISLRHAGFLAGLGIIGKNALLTNPRHGNALALGAVLVDTELPGDPVMQDPFCPENCGRCIVACPGQALSGTGVIQKQCRECSSVITKKGYFLYTCNLCRRSCPNGDGFRAERN